MRDLYHDLRASYVVKPKLVSNDATGNGTGLDILGHQGVKMVAMIGAVGDLFDGSNFVTVRFLESSNNTVFSAIADTDLVGGNNTVLVNANNQANCVHERSYIGSARYVTISFDVTGTMATGTPMVAFVEKGAPLHAPIA